MDRRRVRMIYSSLAWGPVRTKYRGDMGTDPEAVAAAGDAPQERPHERDNRTALSECGATSIALLELVDANGERRYRFRNSIALPWRTVRKLVERVHEGTAQVRTRTARIHEHDALWARLTRALPVLE